MAGKRFNRKKTLVIWMLYNENFWSVLEQIFNDIPSDGVSIQITTGSLDDAVKLRKGFSV